jgi:membrane associated rhomboid family serine protease
MAFLQSGEGREPFLKAPAAVLSLIGVLIAAHAARMLMTPVASERILGEYAFVPLRYSPAFMKQGNVLDRAIPFVSYIFLHADLTHLAVNCLWLLAFGSIVARGLGPALFLLFFLVCGVASAAAYLVLNLGSPGEMIGASGAISGLMAAGIRMLSVPRPGSDTSGFALAPILSSRILAFSGLWVLVNLAFGLSGLSVGGEVQPIAWQAHIGGYFAGLLLIGPFDRWSRKNAGPPPFIA